MDSTGTSLGYKFGYDHVTNGWYDHINGSDYTTEQQSAIVNALTEAQVEEFEALLPDGHFWAIRTSSLQYPPGSDEVIGNLGDLLARSVEAVCERLPEVEATVLAGLRGGT